MQVFNPLNIPKIDQNEGLVCPKCCRRYLAVDGIYSFHDESYAGSFGFQWNKFYNTQLDSYTGLTISKDRLFKSSNWNHNLIGEKILEAGSGAGRFTEVLLKTGADIYSFDLSTAVYANKKNNSAPNLIIFQSSIYEIPLRHNFFDKVLCLGVLQHTPDPKKAFENLAKYVKPDGSLVIDIYANRLRSVISWKYFLRPLTKRINPIVLFRVIQILVSTFITPVKLVKRFLGKFGARLFPITEYCELAISEELKYDWAVLDTFDMYSASYDLPKKISEIRSWFLEFGFENIYVSYGPNGIIGRGIKVGS